MMVDVQRKRQGDDMLRNSFWWDFVKVGLSKSDAGTTVQPASKRLELWSDQQEGISITSESSHLISECLYLLEDDAVQSNVDTEADDFKPASQPLWGPSSLHVGLSNQLHRICILLCYGGCITKWSCLDIE